MVIKNEYGYTYFSVRKTKDGKIHFQMEDCECEMKVKQAKELIEEIREAILRG